jgi:putative tricarboxylic transport membrane protein
MNMLRRGGSARSPQDIVGGLVLVAIALLALYLVNHLPAAGRVGFASGTAPRLFGYGLLALGLWITIGGFLKEGPAIDSFNWRGLFTIIGSVLFFAFCIRTFGLALTGIPMVMIAALASRDGNPLESVIFAAGMTTFCALLFPVALGQPIPLWPSPIAQIISEITGAIWAVITFPAFIVHIPAFLVDFVQVVGNSFATLFRSLVNFVIFMFGTLTRSLIMLALIAFAGYGVFSAIKSKKAGA